MRLFKYVGSHVETILQNNTLKVTPPNGFDDPFEFCPRLDDITDADFDWFLNVQIGERRFIDLLLRERAISNAEEGRFFFRDPFSRNHIKGIIIEAARRHALGNQERAAKEFGVVCFTTHENDMLMWSMYAKNHEGALIEFESEKITNGWSTALIQVEYNDERPRFNIRMSDSSHASFILNVVRRKSTAWHKQGEYRALMPLVTCDSVPAPPAVPSMYLRGIPEDAIVRVVLGARFASKIDEVKKINAGRRFPVTLQKAEKDDDQFRVNYLDLT